MDNKTLSKQYSNLEANDDGFIGIMDAICKKKKSSSSLTATNTKLTFGTLCNADGTDDIKYIKLNQISKINELKTTTENLTTLNNELIKTFKITKLFGISIEELDLGIDYLSVGSFKLSSLLDINPSYDFLRFAECDYGDEDVRTETKETQCMCVDQVSNFNLVTNIYKGTSNACSKECDRSGFNDGGACLTSDTATSTKECRGGTLYKYGESKDQLGCKTDSECYCYTKESLDTIEKKLLCP
ncbi:MAG: hypothetical protein KAJ21_05125 [Thermoplasmatales archaeon]|nr:hypothetical protein [Thermoplasmatales archaeon]